MFAIRGEREEIGLVGPFGTALAERKLGDEPWIDLDAAWYQMTVEGLRQEQTEKDVGARFEPVGRQMPPVVEMIEQGIDVWSSHERTSSRERFLHFSDLTYKGRKRVCPSSAYAAPWALRFPGSAGRRRKPVLDYSTARQIAVQQAHIRQWVYSLAT